MRDLNLIKYCSSPHKIRHLLHFFNTLLFGNSVINSFKMERVRIRSMLNSFKSSQATMTARKADSELQNATIDHHVLIGEDHNKVHHSCFLLQPAYDDSG